MLSVIVPMYNVARVLPETVPAMLAQEEEAEWIFVDDGSTDDTRATLEKLFDSAGTPSRPSVRVLTHEMNRGRAAARNTGVEASGGSILVFMDADVAPARGYLKAMVGAMSDSSAVASIARLEMAEADFSQPYHRYLASSKRGPRKKSLTVPLPWKYFLLGISAVHARAVHEVGAFNEALSYGEDLEFAYRIAQRHPEGLRYAHMAVAHLYDLGDLSTALSKMTKFGRDNLPRMIADYPELARWTGVDVVHSPAHKSVRGAASWLFLRPGLAKTARRVLEYLPHGFSDYAVRFLLGYTLATSYREGLRALQSR